MKRNVLYSIRWAIFIPCAFAVSLITCITLVYGEKLLTELICSSPVNPLSRGHLLFEIFLSMLCVFIYFYIGNKITPPSHKRLGNAILFMVFITLEIGFVLSSVSIISMAPASAVILELMNNIVAVLSAVGLFLFYQQNLHSLPHKKRSLRN